MSYQIPHKNHWTLVLLLAIGWFVCLGISAAKPLLAQDQEPTPDRLQDGSQPTVGYVIFLPLIGLDADMTTDALITDAEAENAEIAPDIDPSEEMMEASALAAVTPAFVDVTEDYKALGYPDARKVARDYTGNLVQVYRKKHNKYYRIFAATSNNAGATWASTALPIENAGDVSQRAPAIAVDKNNVLHVVWSGAGNDSVCPTNSDAKYYDRQIRYARYDNSDGTWAWRYRGVLATVPIAPANCLLLTNTISDTDALWQEHPVIHIAADNTLYVVWEGKNETGNKLSKSTVKFVKSTDGGQTWSYWQNLPLQTSDITLSTFLTGAHFSRPTLITAGSQTLFVFAYATKIDRAQIVWTRSNDGGATWLGWQFADRRDTLDQRHVSGVVDCNQKLHLVWREGPSSITSTVKSYIVYVVHDGTRQISRQKLSSASKYQFFPHIGVKDCSTLWFVWNESSEKSDYPKEDPINARVMMRKKGKSWSSATGLSGSSKAFFPILSSNSVSNRSYIDVVWVEATSSETGTCTIGGVKHSCKTQYADLTGR